MDPKHTTAEPAALTIVARRPCNLAVDNLDPPPGGELNGPTETLMSKLRPLGNADPRNIIRRATTLAHIVNILRNVKPAGLVQIVGHGMPGVVQLGAAWTHPSDGQVYQIDSDINHYGIVRKYIGPANRVRLLGCTAGMESTSTVEDGPTMLFTFARLWKTEVAGPWTTFDENDFDFEQGGIFKSASKLVIANDKGVSRPGTKVDQPIGIGRTNVTFQRLVSAPMLARITKSFEPRPLLDQVMKELSSASFASGQLTELFAAAELVFEVVANGQPWTCDVIAGQTMIRLHRDGAQSALLIPSEAARAQLSELIAVLASDTGKVYAS